MKKSKSILKAITCSTLGFFIITGSAQADRVLASIDGYPVLESQVKSIKGKNESLNVALDRLIDDILVQRAIQESGIQITAEQLELIIEDIAARNGLTYGQFLDALDYQGISLDDFVQQVVNQVIMSEVQNQAISRSISVTHEEVEALGKKMLSDAKAKNKNAQIMAKEYEVRHILIKLTPLLNDAQAKAQLSKIRSDIMAGKTTFAEAALNYSKDYLSGANGGNLGYAFPENYVEAFAQTVKKTKQGVISAPFKTEFGWHILEVTGTRNADRTEDAYLQKAYEQLVNAQFQEASKDWIKALRKNAHIEYLNQ